MQDGERTFSKVLKLFYMYEEENMSCFVVDSFPDYFKVVAISWFILWSVLCWLTLNICTDWTTGWEPLVGVFEDQTQSAFIHCLSLDMLFKMVREAKFLFGQFSTLYDRTPLWLWPCKHTPLSDNSQPSSVVEESICTQRVKKATGSCAGMSGMSSVSACSIPRGFHLGAACSHAQGALVHECE